VYAAGRKLDQMQGLVALGCRLQQLDVTDEAAVARVVQAVVQEAGRIDILINNAGVALKGWAIETPLKDVRRLMEVRCSVVAEPTTQLSGAVAVCVSRRSFERTTACCTRLWCAHVAAAACRSTSLPCWR
jgi:NADP-dependent 3-hydroxy acid dehydrogenase YdfG